MSYRNSQSGSAIITALFIMALVTIMAVAMTTRLQIDIHRTQLLLNFNKIYFTASGVKYWAIGSLLQNARQSSNDTAAIDHLPEYFPTINDNGVLLNGKLSDLQARFNINNMADPSYAKNFMHLLKYVAPTITALTALQIINGIEQHLLRNQSDLNSSVVADNDTSKKLANPFASISELRLIPGVSASLLQQLSPYITALPEVTPININTAPLAILRSLGDGLTEAQANTIINARQTKNGFKSIEEFTADPAFSNLNIPNQLITVTSNYFLAQANAIISQHKLILFTVIKRHITKKSIIITAISETRNDT
jgi:general secretion pathway protein K